MNRQPPKLINRFLRWVCNEEMLEEVEGDLYELYERRSKHSGKLTADLYFLVDVLFALRWMNLKKNSFLKNLSGQLSLTRSYLKIGFRNIRKHSMVSTISILSLSIAIAICITAMIFYDIQVNMDQFHKKGDRIYQITSLTTEKITGKTPIDLATNLESSHPFVEEAVRVERYQAYVLNDKDVYRENIAFVDPAFFEVFDFPFIAGNQKSLSARASMVISYDIAKKYFPNSDPIGKTLILRYQHKDRQAYTVTGVLDRYSDYASFYFDFYLPFEHLPGVSDRSEISTKHIDATFALIREGAGPGQLRDACHGQLLNDPRKIDEEEIMDFALYPLFDLSERCHEIAASLSFTAPAFTRISLAIISGMLLLLTTFGFINITLTSYAKRLKEIGIRKVIGGNQQQVVIQFLTENFLICSIAFMLGAFLSYAVFTRGLNFLLPMRIPFSFSSWEVLTLNGLGLFVGILLITGLYPALYISRLSADRILKGATNLRKNGSFSKVLLAVQLTFAFITIVGSVVFAANAINLRDRSWGYTPDDVLFIRTINSQKMQQIANKVAQNPDVERFSVSKAGHVGFHNTTYQYNSEGVPYKAVLYQVDSSYNRVLGLRLIRGRWFDGTQAEYQNSVIVNQKLVRQHNWKDALGKEVEIDGKVRKIIGVVGDLYLRSVSRPPDPIIFTGFSEDTNDVLYYVVAKTIRGRSGQVQEKIRLAWQEIAPDEPFVSNFQVAALDGFFDQLEATTLIVTLLSSIAFLIAMSGLFGLFSYSIHRRLKEFSIRKVLGATPVNLVFVAGKSIVWAVGVALVAGGILGHLFINILLDIMYEDYSATGMLPYLMAGFCIVTLLFLTIAGQLSLAMKVNPVENLKDE